MAQMKYVLGYKLEKILNNSDNHFFSHIKIPEDLNGCVEWTGNIKPNGYGVMCWKGKNYYAHRYSFKYYYGKIPKDMQVLHRCDNRKCVRPDHLFYGTQATNTRDMYRKGRNKSNAPKGIDCHFSKIDEKVVKLIKRKLIEYENIKPLRGRYKKISIELNINYTIIEKIYYGKTWKHVQLDN